MDVAIQTLGVSKEVFIEKVLKELKQGVKVKTGNVECIEVTRVWTDSPVWQFSILGLIECDSQKLESIIIESIGISKSFLQLKVRVEEFLFKMERISKKFGELEGVPEEEARLFLDGFMESKFNRFLTAQLFKEMAEDENFQQWLIF
ncbi:MAG: hypothetical protein WCJ58_06205 [bacterium]